MSKKDKQPRKPKQFKPRKKKLDRKEAKQPDQFMDYTKILFDWMQTNIKAILIGVSAVVVIALAVSVWQWRSDKRTTAAGQTLSLALRNSSNPVKSFLDKATLKKLPEEQKTYDTVVAKYTDLAKIYKEVIGKFEGTRASELARLGLAMADLRRGKQAGVEELIKKFIKSHEESPLRWIGIENLGIFYEVTGKTKQAVAQYTRLTKGSSVYIQIMGTIHLADLYRTSDPAKAKGFYNKVMTDKKFGKYFLQSRRGDIRKAIRKKLDLMADSK